MKLAVVSLIVMGAEQLETLSFQTSQADPEGLEEDGRWIPLPMGLHGRHHS